MNWFVSTLLFTIVANSSVVAMAKIDLGDALGVVQYLKDKPDLAPQIASLQNSMIEQINEALNKECSQCFRVCVCHFLVLCCVLFCFIQSFDKIWECMYKNEFVLEKAVFLRHHKCIDFKLLI